MLNLLASPILSLLIAVGAKIQHQRAAYVYVAKPAAVPSRRAEDCTTAHGIQWLLPRESESLASLKCSKVVCAGNTLYGFPLAVGMAAAHYSEQYLRHQLFCYFHWLVKSARFQRLDFCVGLYVLMTCCGG